MNLGRFQDAIARFDAANAQDPRGIELPYAQQLSAWVARLAPDASEALRLAARCQHLRRWEIPRESYPVGRVGYLQWREDLKRFHADEAGKILREVGYDDEMIQLVQRIVLKKDSAVMEDALCLVFLETQLQATTGKTGEAKMISILQKTWRKMSPHGRGIALTLPMSHDCRVMIERALDPGCLIRQSAVNDLPP